MAVLYTRGQKIKRYAAKHHGVLDENDDEQNSELPFAILGSSNASSVNRAICGCNKNLRRCVCLYNNFTRDTITAVSN